MPLDAQTRRLIFAIKRNYYDPQAREKYLGYAPDRSYSLYLDLIYQLCALLVGHRHPAQLSAEDTYRLLDNPIMAQTAGAVIPLLRADVLARLREIHGSPEKAEEAHRRLVSAILEDAPEV